MDSRFVAASALAALVTLITIFSLRRLAPRLGLVDRPDERKWHRGRVPLVGGLCFFLGTIVGLAYFGHLDRFMVCLLATGALIFLTGLIDDLEGLSVSTRLLVQAGAAGMVIASSGIYIDGLGHLFGGEFRLHALGIPVTIIAVIGLINAFNMLDGIDGLAGSMALVSIACILSFASAGWPTLGVALLLQILSVSLIPYLFVNLGWPDGRKVFMGDAGSTLIGFLLAWSLIFMSHRQVRQLAPADVLWCIAIPIMDIVAVMYRRMRKGLSPFKSDRRHLHHLLLEAGYSSRETLALIVAGGLFVAAIGYVLREAPGAVSLIAFLVVLVAYVRFLPQVLERLRSKRLEAAPAGDAPALPTGGTTNRDKPGARDPAQAPVQPSQPARAHVSKALCVLGASVDDIAVAPIMQQLSGDERFDIRVCVAAAPNERTAQMLRLFGIQPDLDLGIDMPEHDANGTTLAALGRMKRVLSEFQPDVVLIHGDTPTTLATALAACYEQVPLVRMDTWLPFEGRAGSEPDEANHSLISTLASLHITSTELSGRNLVSAGIPEERVTVAGNTAVDTLRSVVRMIKQNGDAQRDLALRFSFLREGNPLLLVVNRATRGNGFGPVDRALRRLAKRRPDLDIVYCTGLSPDPDAARLRRELANIHLLEPLDYLGFAYLLNAAYLVLANSEEVRNEAIALNKPVLMVRDGTAQEARADDKRSVAGNEREIVECVMTLLVDRHACEAMRLATDPAGDGTETCVRIAEVLANLPQRAPSLAA